eukprot:6083021-Pleurochrysis_carterae.AAC.2
MQRADTLRRPFSRCRRADASASTRTSATAHTRPPARTCIRSHSTCPVPSMHGARAGLGAHW